ncbi:MAG TPA: valine--pyruvate transaminase [Chthoniobacteraceae bacterium]|jgi:valine--pyruvate aminotransferase|nr:valine--pyruvate transaminase [Chthoniobacteraceae bacterium]
MERGFSDFGEKLSAHSGIYDLMEDLGQALAAGGKIMMGGGNPAHIPGVEAVWRRRMEEILASPGALESMLGDYDTPRGRPDFLSTFATYLEGRLGWPIGPENIAITTGSQAANFLLFNLLAGPAEHGKQQRRVLFPVVPEYIGYVDQGVSPDMFRAWRPEIELHGADLFKYRMAPGRITPDIAAICVSRPTNPSANVITGEELATLSRMAAQSGARLIIDHAYGLPFPGVIFSDVKPPPWEDHVIHTFSLSKLGLPTSRTGIIVADAAIIERIARMNAQVVLATSTVGQTITRPLFASGEITRLCAEVVRPFYQARSRAALEALRESLAGYEHYRVHECEGSFFLWLWLPRLPVSDRELYSRLKKRGLLVVPGSYFFPGLQEPWEHTTQCIRLTYSAEPAAVKKGMLMLAEEIKGL